MSATLKIRPDGLYILSGVTASYPHLSAPSLMPGETDKEKARYKLTALVTVDDKDVYDQLKAAMVPLIPKGKKLSKPPFAEVSPDKLPQSWADKYGVSAFQVRLQSKAQPKVYNAAGQLDPDCIKGGDKVTVAFTAFCFGNAYGQFLQLQLVAVRKVADDLDFGGTGGAVSVDASELGGPVSAPTANDDPFGDSNIPF